VPGLLARARIFALSSQAEGVSLTLLEAMARGLPVVTTRVGGNPEVVLDGQTGVLVPPRDPPAMAKAIIGLLGDMSGCQQLGRAGRQRVEKHFTSRRMVAAYEKLYTTPIRTTHSPARPVPDATSNGVNRLESSGVGKRASIHKLPKTQLARH